MYIDETGNLTTNIDELITSKEFLGDIKPLDDNKRHILDRLIETLEKASIGDISPDEVLESIHGLVEL